MFRIANLKDFSVEAYFSDGYSKVMHDPQSEQICLQFLIKSETSIRIVIHEQSIEPDVLILEHKVLLSQIAPFIGVSEVSNIMFFSDVPDFMKQDKCKGCQPVFPFIEV